MQNTKQCGPESGLFMTTRSCPALLGLSSLYVLGLHCQAPSGLCREGNICLGDSLYMCACMRITCTRTRTGLCCVYM